jgi:hypothetical protein
MPPGRGIFLRHILASRRIKPVRYAAAKVWYSSSVAYQTALREAVLQDCVVECGLTAEEFLGADEIGIVENGIRIK